MSKIKLETVQSGSKVSIYMEYADYQKSERYYFEDFAKEDFFHQRGGRPKAPLKKA